MKSRLILCCVMAVVLCAGASISSAADEKTLVVADFDAGDKPNNIGGDFGVWDKDPADDTQGAGMTFESDDALGDPSGYSVRLNYDVDSPNPAYNGFWMKLNGEDVRDFNALSFYVKGDRVRGFTKRVKIELKDGTGKPSAYAVSNITDEWQKVSIPFDKFRRITGWDALTEFVVVFDDVNSAPKSGSILIDQIAFVKE